MTRGRNGSSVPLVLLSVGVLLGAVGLAAAQPAPDSNSVLLLAKSVRNPAKSVEATQAAALGFTVVVATDEQWTAMSPDQFASYKAIVIGDGMCTGRTSQLAAEANRDVWSPAVTGNVIVVGTRPAVAAANSPGAVDLVRDGLRFAAGGQGTGAYITPSCYMSATPVPVKVLQAFGTFTAARQNACPRVTHLVANNASTSDLTDAGLSGWQCTADAGFVEWPSGFDVLAIATNGNPGQYTASDGTTGSPFILTRQPAVTSPSSSGASSPSSSDASSPSSSDASSPSSSGASLLASLQPLSTVSSSSFDPTASIPIKLSGTHFLFKESGSTHIDGLDVDVGAHAEAYATWAPQGSSNLSWNGDKLRQGENPGLTNTLDPGHGNLKIAVGGGVSIGSVNIDLEESLDGDCALHVDGSPYDCSLPVTCIDIPGASLDLVLGSISLCVSIEVQTGITPHDLTVDRAMLYSTGDETGPDTLTFPPLTLDDGFKVSCYVPEGTEIVYQLTDPSTTPDTGFGVGVGIGINGCIGICPLCDCGTLGSITLFSTGSILDFSIPLTGTGGEASLGTVLPDVTPPNLQNVNVSYSGNEGSPITFSAAGTQDSCLETVTFTWDFSDGGKAFGSPTEHTFADGPVTYSGRLWARDLAGNVAGKDFSTTVTNVAPVVNAGPDMGSAWGVPVAFNGSATDPGAGDQATLHYEWTFGDGTPSATGGPSVSHAYANPGTYAATLKVCDKDGACQSDTAAVTVRKRKAVVGYLGDQNGVFDTLTTLKASLTDEFGAFVQGRTVAFAIGTEADTAATNSAGIAATSHLLELAAGSYTATASFAGDTRYDPAPPSSAAYSVAQKPTSLTYTGALSGAPNKVITLSAVLVDSQGKALAGRTIAFQLGTQSASATTDANGLAATSLKLAQKNGTYQLTSTFAPAGTDVGRYVSSAASSTFKLQSR